MTAKEIAPGGVANITTLVQYGDDAIVSRILLKSNTGSVTLFAFAEGQELSEHTTPFDALVQVVDGNGLFTIGNEDYSVGTGEAIILPANIPHAVKAASRFKMILTMLR